MSTTTILPDAFFSITNPHNPHAVARSIARKATFQAWCCAGVSSNTVVTIQ